ncbi:MAG TPA: DinB family protein [Pyrinomonadaceae bacterium]|nr:DinB family protein [Pyrinomonadaceae bacterium]
MNSPEIKIIEALERAPNVVLPLVREVPHEILKRRPRPGKWSAHEHACHLAEVHHLFFERLELMTREDNPRIVPYNPDEALAADALLNRDLDRELERFMRDRKGLVERLKQLTEEDWQRTAQHDEYDHYSVFIMMRHLALHDFLHAYRIEELLLKKDWQ